MQPVRDAVRARLHFQNLTNPPFGQGLQAFGQSLAVAGPGQQIGAGRHMQGGAALHREHALGLVMKEHAHTGRALH